MQERRRAKPVVEILPAHHDWRHSSNDWVCGVEGLHLKVNSKG